MVNEEPDRIYGRRAEIKEFVDEFIASFIQKFGYKPIVMFSNNEFKGVTKVLPFPKIEEIANRQLKEALDNSNSKFFFPITSKKRKRMVIYYKHCTAKLMYDMGYTMTYIAKCLNMSHSTVSVSVYKIHQFVGINDAIICNILNSLKNEIIEQQNNTIDNF